MEKNIVKIIANIMINEELPRLKRYKLKTEDIPGLSNLIVALSQMELLELTTRHNTRAMLDNFFKYLKEDSEIGQQVRELAGYHNTFCNSVE